MNNDTWLLSTNSEQILPKVMIVKLKDSRMKSSRLHWHTSVEADDIVTETV